MRKTPRKAMVVTPHPDDAEIGCGGTVGKWTKEGCEVVYVVCTNGDKGTSDPKMTPAALAEIREKEQKAAAQTLGVKEVVFLRYPDGELEDTRKFRGELVRQIRIHRPEVVITVDPFRKSFYLHRDHRITGQVTLDAVFPYSRDLLHYPEHMAEGLKPHKVSEVYLGGSEESDTFVDISETIELKIKAIGCHLSQVSNSEGKPFQDWVREWAKETGKEQGMDYAEGFRRFNLSRIDEEE